ncbi:MAG TPA: hemerythrin domain-containing protein [Burkholderiales bacterium]|nr:hemerythrin domain-containing protein [Burkholderiales bacterium]
MPEHANALELLRRDHEEVQQMFHRYTSASGTEQERLCSEMVEALKLHARIEEEVFYPYVRAASGRQDLVEEANVEHEASKTLIADLESGRNGLHRQAVVKVLSEYLGHHIREEEERIFPLIESSGVDLDALGEELLEHRKRTPGKEHFGQTLATRDPAVIKAWADERGAKPATSPGDDPRNPRVLRFDFPNYDKSLQEVSWEAWCRAFDERQLVFVFQQQPESGSPSNFFRLDAPRRDDA